MSNRNAQIKIRVTAQEADTMRKNAKSCDKILTAYLRTVGSDMCIYCHNVFLSEAHTQPLSATQNSLSHLLLTVGRISNYVPGDMIHIINKMKEIMQLEKEFLGIELQIWDNIKHHIATTTQALVDKHLSENDTV